MGKVAKTILHLSLTLGLSFAIFGLPILSNLDFGGASSISSGGTISLPEKPSGEFRVYMKTSPHLENLSKWEAFFKGDEENITVIFDDIVCSVTSSDPSAYELGLRYQIYLPENQMKLKRENATLLASKVETGHIDVAIFSKEVAEYLELAVDESEADITVFRV